MNIVTKLLEVEYTFIRLKAGLLQAAPVSDQKISKFFLSGMEASREHVVRGVVW
jgi:hypothetical protein